MMTRLVSGFLAVSLGAALAACSGSDGGGTGGTNPAPSGTSTTPAPQAGFVIQSGTINDFTSEVPVAGATVQAGDVTATTDAKGRYELQIPQNQAFSMVVTADSYVKLIEQPTVLSKDFARGKTYLVPTDAAQIMKNLLRNDDSKALLSVNLMPTGNCKSVAGATVSVVGADETDWKVKYFIQRTPSASASSVQDGAFPSAVVYDLDPTKPVTLKVEGLDCAQAAFPFDEGDGITFLGDTKMEAGGSTASFQRIFLQ